MQPLPTPCPPGLVPAATDVDAFNAAYRRAKQQHQVFVAVAEQGRRWMVKADTLTAGQDHTIVDSTYHAIRAAVFRLIRSRQIRARLLGRPGLLRAVRRGERVSLGRDEA